MTSTTNAAERKAAAATAVLNGAGFTAQRSRADVIATLREVCGVKRILTDEFRDAFLAGNMAARIFPDAREMTPEMLTRAREVLNARNMSAKTLADGQRRRTKAEESMFGAARQALSALLKDAGIKTNQAKGGANNKTGRKPRPGANKDGATSAEGSIPIAPDAGAEADKANTEVRAASALDNIKTPAGTCSHVMAQAAALLAFADKHKNMPATMRKIVRDFHKRAMAHPMPRD